MRSKRNLVPGSNGNLLTSIVSSRADVNQIDTDILQLLREDRRLLDTPKRRISVSTRHKHPPPDSPEPPLAVSRMILVVLIIAPLLTLEPIRRTDTVEDRLVPLFPH